MRVGTARIQELEQETARPQVPNWALQEETSGFKQKIVRVECQNSDYCVLINGAPNSVYSTGEKNVRHGLQLGFGSGSGSGRIVL